LTAFYFDGVKISAYGQKTSLSELVQFVPKTANVMVLNVFDEGLAPDIVKVNSRD
jgi:Ribosome recycling factor